MPNCNHEGTDIRIVVHILHALNRSMKSVMVHTVNTDIILNLVGAPVLQPLVDGLLLTLGQIV